MRYRTPPYRCQDADFSTRWTLIKRGFSARIANGECRSASRIAKAERGIWQRRFWEHTIRDDTDFARHVDYVHFNPVKHGLVSNAADRPFSSFRRAATRRDYPSTWAGPKNPPANTASARKGEESGGV